MAFKDRVKEARKAARLTQLQAATQIGVAKSTWAGYESGNSTPDIDKLTRIMDILSVDANYLWQDYKLDRITTPPVPEETEVCEQSTYVLETELRALLIRLNLIAPGEELTADQSDFLLHLAALIKIYFKK